MGAGTRSRDEDFFAVGRLERDQVADTARRKGVPLHEAERWLAPNLGYEGEGTGADRGSTDALREDLAFQAATQVGRAAVLGAVSIGRSIRREARTAGL